MPTAKHHENLFQPLFTTCLSTGIMVDGSDKHEPHLQHYQSDLGWDAITISRAEVGDVFMWGHRQSGTHICRITEDNRRNCCGMARYDGVAPANWYILKVTKATSHGCTSGTFEHMGAATRDEVLDRVYRELEALATPQSDEPWQQRLTSVERARNEHERAPAGWREVEGGEEKL